MNKGFILSAFLVFFLLIFSAGLIAENANSTENAEAAGRSVADSFDRLTGKVLRSLAGDLGEKPGTGDIASYAGKEPGGPVVAVLSIRNTDGRDSVLGNYLEERLTDLLVSKTDLSVVERNQIEQIMGEWEYSLSGMVEGDSMYEIGAMAGADAVLVGILTRIDQSVQVNLRIIDPESALVLASVDSLLSEPRYLSMYLDIFDSDELTEEDFFIGRGRDFDRDRAFLDSFFALCRGMEEQTGRIDFLDGSFLEYLESTTAVEFTQGSRQNCTLKVRKDQFEPRYVYNFFFSDGRSKTVWYYDERSYGWHTNPFFQELVERDYDTFGVPGIYRDAVVRSAAFSAPADIADNSSESIDNGRIQCAGSGSSPEWALLHALMKAALMIETRMEVVTFRGDAGAVDFVTEYVPLENLEGLSGSIIEKTIQAAGDVYSARIRVDASGF